MTEEPLESVGEEELQFVLRHYLPRDRFADQLTELVNHCRNHGIQEVLLFPHGLGVDDSSSGYWQPDELADDRERLILAREALHRAGIRFGINIWHTIGHGHRGRSWAADFPFQPLVSDAGETDSANACPLCPRWRTYYMRALKECATSRPDRLFLDDDVRWFHHSARYNCFCPLHLDAFAQRYGTRYDRETLIRDVLRPGPPHPARRQWFELLQSQMVGLVSEIERVVHAVCPETQLGLMSSLPDTMAMEGRRWEPLLRALAGPGRPLLYRPYYPCYLEIPPRELPRSLAVYRQIFAELPDQVEAFAELDNCYPTEFNQSPAHMVLRMFLAALCGTRGFHLSLYGFHGNADTFEGSREYGAMLDKFRHSWRTIARMFSGKPTARGLNLPTHPHRVRDRELSKGNSLSELTLDSLSWAGPLQLAGFPITFEPSWASALTADALNGHTKEELQKLLAGWALLDASAVEWLHARGWGEWLGTLTISGPEDRNPALAEEVVAVNDPHHGALFEHKPLQAVGAEARWTVKPEAQIITILRGCRKKPLGPGAFQFLNAQGGQIEAVPLNPASLTQNPFLTRYRLDGLKMRMLDAAQIRGEPFFVVENPPNTLPLLLEVSGHMIPTVVNLRSQSCPAMRLRGVHLPEFKQAMIFHEGTLCSFPFHQEPGPNGTSRLTLDGELPPLACVLFTER